MTKTAQSVAVMTVDSFFMEGNEFSDRVTAYIIICIGLLRKRQAARPGKSRGRKGRVSEVSVFFALWHDGDAQQFETCGRLLDDVDFQVAECHFGALVGDGACGVEDIAGESLIVVVFGNVERVVFVELRDFAASRNLVDVGSDEACQRSGFVGGRVRLGCRRRFPPRGLRGR